MLSNKLKILTILAVSLNLSACKDLDVPSWTLREDCVARRTLSDEDCKELNLDPGCKEELALKELLDRIKEREKKSFAILVTPGGAEEITNAIKDCRDELASCKAGRCGAEEITNAIKDCRDELASCKAGR